MSLSSDKMMKLMAYADGELEGNERNEAEMLLATDSDAVMFVEQIASLGDLVVRGHEERLGGSAASFDVAREVVALTSNVSLLGAARGKTSRERTSREKTSREKTSREKTSREKTIGNGLTIGAAVAALALAASLVVFVQHHREEMPMASVAPASAVPGTGVAVESAGTSVSVFYLPTANELSTSVVVWVDETGEK